MTFSWGTPHVAEQEQAAQSSEKVVTRAERAHYRLSWEERLARNALACNIAPLTVTLHGLPPAFALSFGFALQAAA